MTEIAHKISKGISLIDELVNDNDTNHYDLFLQVGLDGLSYCIVDSRNSKYIALESFTFQNVYNYSVVCENLKVIVEKHPVLSKSFKKVQAALVHNKSTLIPNPLFDSANKMDYIKFNYSVEEEDVISIDSLKNIDAKNLFVVPSCLETTLGELFPSLTIIHHSTSLLENLVANYKNQNDKKIFVHVQLSHFEIIVLEGKHLILYNSFRHQTSEDFVYYLLFVCEQLKLNPENMDLILIGEVERNSAIYTILQKYVRHIKFDARNDNFEYSYKFNNIPRHFYYNLFSQYLCV